MLIDFYLEQEDKFIVPAMPVTLLNTLKERECFNYIFLYKDSVLDPIPEANYQTRSERYDYGYCSVKTTIDDSRAAVDIVNLVLELMNFNSTNRIITKTNGFVKERKISIFMLNLKNEAEKLGLIMETIIDTHYLVLAFTENTKRLTTRTICL